MDLCSGATLCVRNSWTVVIFIRVLPLKRRGESALDRLVGQRLEGLENHESDNQAHPDHFGEVSPSDNRVGHLNLKSGSDRFFGARISKCRLEGSPSRKKHPRDEWEENGQDNDGGEQPVAVGARDGSEDRGAR